MDKQHSKRGRRTRKKIEGKNTHRFTLSSTQKLPNWKTLGYDVVHGFWFKKSNSIDYTVAIGMNRCLQEVDVPE